jgi:hypothetical protein
MFRILVPIFSCRPPTSGSVRIKAFCGDARSCNDGQVLVLRDLAEADDGELVGHGVILV